MNLRLLRSKESGNWALERWDMKDASNGGFSEIAANATFILGFARSGTTLLRSLLDNHSELVVFPGEMKFFKRAGEVNAETFLRRTDFRLCFDPSEYRIKGIRYDDVLRGLEIRLNAGVCLKDMMLSVVESYAEIEPSGKGNKKRWVEKTPANARFLPTLENWFAGDTKYIWIIRDPRDVFASNLKKHSSYGVEEFCREYRKHLANFRLLEKKVGKRLHPLRYEDLVAEPRGNLLRLSAFLEVGFEPGMEIPTINGTPWTGNSRFGLKSEGIGGDSAGRFAERLDVSQVRYIERKLGVELMRWGYFLSSGSSSRMWGVDLARKYDEILARLEWSFPILQRKLLKRVSA
jgi:hypothetical protein